MYALLKRIIEIFYQLYAIAVEARPGMHCTSHILSISRDARSLFDYTVSTSSRCV